MANPYVVAGGTIVGLGLFTGLMVWARKAHAAPEGTQVTPANVLNSILFAIKQQGLGNEELAAKTRKNGAGMARLLGLKKTAAALEANKPLPEDENWPGTNMSVKAFVQEAVTQASSQAQQQAA